MLSSQDERFELLREVGKGGYGTVYEARDREDGSRVALKVLHAGAVGRFEREVEALSELRHPNVVRYLGHGLLQGNRRYLAMEWLEGETLEHRLERGLLSVRELLALARPLVDAMALAEQRGLVHRDLKPANLFLHHGELAQVKVLDFGLARRVNEDLRQTRTGTVLGTPLYMSPEQARGEADLDARADVFSAGCVLYTCLAGKAPFMGTSVLATLAKICFDAAPSLTKLRADVPAPLAELVDEMLAKLPSERPSFAKLAPALNDLTPSVIPVAYQTPLLAEHESSPPVAAKRSSLSPHSQQRVLCAVFVGPSDHPLRELESKLQLFARQHDARYAQLLDGSSVLLLDGPLPASEQALVAARCALSLRELLPAAPIVVCTGRAVLDGTLPVGALIERGADLVGFTPRGALLVDDPSAGLLDARFEIRGEHGQRSLKRERLEGEAPRTLLGQITPFVGRERNLEDLVRAFRGCVEDGGPRAVLVTAPAGAGKSRLRHEFLQRLHEDAPFALFVGRGDAVRRATPLSALAPALRAWANVESGDSAQRKQEKLRLAAEGLLGVERGRSAAVFLGEMSGIAFAEDADPQLSGARRDPKLMGDLLLASFLDWLEAHCAGGPVLFVIEDLNWADPASVRFLGAALRSVGERPLMVVAFARPEVHEVFPRLWAERDMLEMRLVKLSPRSQERLLGMLENAQLSPEQRAWIIERADGNPFVLEELVRGLRSAGLEGNLPDSVLGMVQARLDALGEQAKAILRAGSIFGQAFRPDALQSLLGGHVGAAELESWLLYLTEREVIFPRSGSGVEREYLFRHALVREAAYALLPDEERALGHRLAGEWLEARGSVEAALLADHYEKGGALPQAVRWYCAAVTRGLDASSVEDLVRLAERAQACGADGQELAEVACAVGDVLAHAGDPDRAVGWAQIARSKVRLGEPTWWDALRLLAGAQVFGSGGGSVEGVDLVDEILAFVMEHATYGGSISAQQITALSELACGCIVVGREDRAMKLMSAIPQDATALHGQAKISLGFATGFIAVFRGNFDTALQAFRVAVDESRLNGSLRRLDVAHANMGFMFTELGLYEAAEASCHECLAVAKRLGSHLVVAMGEQNLGLCYLRQRRFVEAEQVLRVCAATLTRLNVDHTAAVAWAYLAWTLSEHGDHAQALEANQRALELSASSVSSQMTAKATLSRVQLLGGRIPEAMRAAEQARQLMHEHLLSEHAALVHCTYAEALLASERIVEARVALRDAQSWLSQRGERLVDPVMRKSFFGGVPEHARIMQLAREHLPVTA